MNRIKGIPIAKAAIIINIVTKIEKSEFGLNGHFKISSMQALSLQHFVQFKVSQVAAAAASYARLKLIKSRITIITLDNDFLILIGLLFFL
jgi:hypothetical protein